MDYTKHENIPESREVFVYRFKHIKTDKLDRCFLIECESDEI